MRGAVWHAPCLNKCVRGKIQTGKSSKARQRNDQNETAERSKQMLRISINEGTEAVEMKLEGRVAGLWAAEVGRVWVETAPRLAGRTGFAQRDLCRLRRHRITERDLLTNESQISCRYGMGTITCRPNHAQRRATSQLGALIWEPCRTR